MNRLEITSPDRLLRQMLEEAAEAGASDIHIEPQESFVRVRFRKDGVLSDMFHLPPKSMNGLSVRTKVLGHMDVGESRLPQDGSFSERLGRDTFDFRISILPSLYGETIVIRLLSSRVDFIENNDLGMLPLQEAVFRRALAARRGMILTAGPTGSGKTSTLYAALKLLNQESVSIISVEDPVEYHVPGVTQIQVNEKAGLTFDNALRSIVRQDPDIIMIGEIRDRKTAEMAVHASLTGHLVLSTIHTNHANEAPLRLMDMGIPSYLLSASLSLVMAQRLSPKLCKECRKEMTLTGEMAAELRLPSSLAGSRVYESHGCSHCREGRQGRIGVFEMISIGKTERALLHHDVDSDALKERMKETGQPSMGETALLLMKEGLIGPKDASYILEGEDS